MIDSQQVKDGRMDIVDGRRALSVERLVAPGVAFPDRDTPTDAATTKPVGETMGIVVPPLAPLRAGHATEFRGPEDDSILQKPSLPQVLDQSGGTPGEPHRERTMVPLEVLMGIPIPARMAIVVAAPDLHESNTPLQQSPRDQAPAPERVHLFLGIDLLGPGRRIPPNTIGVEDVFGFAGQVESFRSSQLHPRGEFITTDPRLKPRIPVASHQM